MKIQGQFSAQINSGTIVHFVTAGIKSALAQARNVAAGREIRLGGGVATIRAYLEAGLIDQMHVAISPVLLGRGEHLFAGLDLPALGYTLDNETRAGAAYHLFIRRREMEA